MNSPSLARIEALFHAALELPVAERAAYLLTTEPDATVRAAVLRLLAQHTQSDIVLERALDAAVAQANQVNSPARIGPYRLLRELGSGGMGTVYLAERDVDGAVQQVAVKLLRGFPTSEARGRMARERSLLAGLNHPNIACLLDGGDTLDGQPYLVMEYVAGAPLLAFCRQQHLDVDARLRLFVQLCRAVQHAHQRLIVHRDIKPANVQVREDGAPVLLDFGIGKLLDGTAPDATATRVFTPAYAAPEQLAGRSVTTAADIYGLGCVLFELLTEIAVADVGGDSRPIPAPSAAVAESARARALRGDLDTLVLKAVQPEAERRYASAQALAEDVENYLAGRPLSAAPDSFAYRSAKFLARHRVAMLVVALALVALVGFVWRLNAERERALRAEALAAREAQSTQRSRDFLVSLFSAAAPGESLGRALTARELIDHGRARLDHELKDEPEAAARLALTISEVYGALGDPAAAATNAEQALALAGDTPQMAILRADILEELGTHYDNLDRLDEGKRALQQALDLRLRHAPDAAAALAGTLNELGHAAERRGETDASQDYLQRALALAEDLNPANPALLADILRGLALVAWDNGKFAAALVYIERALAVAADLPAESPDRIELWRVQSRVQMDSGDANAAVGTLENAYKVIKATVGENSTAAANLENDLATMLSPLGRYREAITHLENSLRISAALRPDDPMALAVPTMNLGSMYENLGDYAHAGSLMEQSIKAFEARSTDDPTLDLYRANLARNLALRGDTEAALALMRRAMETTAAHSGIDSFDYGFACFRMARIELRAGLWAAAAQHLNQGIALLDPELPAQHPLRAQFARIRGLIARRRGDLAESRRELEAAVAILSAKTGIDPVMLAEIRSELAGVAMAQKDYPAARAALTAALPVLHAGLLPEAPVLNEALQRAAQLETLEVAPRQ